VGVVRAVEVFQGTHILGASRSGLCDSSAFLFSLEVAVMTVVLYVPCCLLLLMSGLFVCRFSYVPVLR